MSTPTADPLPLSVRLFAPWRWRHRKLLVAAFLMLLLYPISQGPVMQLVATWRVPQATVPYIEASYRPLVLASDYVPGLMDALNWHAHKWSRIIPPTEELLEHFRELDLPAGDNP